MHAKRDPPEIPETKGMNMQTETCLIQHQKPELCTSGLVQCKASAILASTEHGDSTWVVHSLANQLWGWKQSDQHHRFI